jgi:hypothetical protein
MASSRGTGCSFQACSRATSVYLRTCGPEGSELGRAGAAGSFADLAVGELGDDVEMAEVTGVLLQQVEQDPLQ